MTSLIPTDTIERMIYLIRGHRVMFDSDLAELYEVETKVFNQSVKRNLDLFPSDFMFQLTDGEWDVLRSQIVTSKEGKGGRRYNPYVFTEQGVAMLSSVLKSSRAKRVNIEIMRAFVRYRHILASQHEIIQRIDALEQRYDQQFSIVFEAIRQMMKEPGESRQIGFRVDE